MYFKIGIFIIRFVLKPVFKRYIPTAKDIGKTVSPEKTNITVRNGTQNQSIL